VTRWSWWRWTTKK